MRDSALPQAGAQRSGATLNESLSILVESPALASQSPGSEARYPEDTRRSFMAEQQIRPVGLPHPQLRGFGISGKRSPRLRVSAANGPFGIFERGEAGLRAEPRATGGEGLRSRQECPAVWSEATTKEESLSSPATASARKSFPQPSRWLKPP